MESGSEYQITAGATATSSLAVGKYQWSLFVIDSSDAQKRQFLDNGVFEIKPNWSSSTVDPRSDARKNLELFEDILYNRIQGDPLKEENLQFDVVVALTSPDKVLLPEELTEAILNG